MVRNSSNNPYAFSNTTPTGIELDMRLELYRTLYGAQDEISKGRVGLLRRVRRSNGEPVRCSCRDIITDEPDRDYLCRYCWNMGFLFDEHKIVYYRSDRSFNENKDETSGFYFYFQYSEDIDELDVLVDVNIDKEGKIILPVTRTKYYEILRASKFNSDNGRLEHYRIKARELNNWSVWYGIKFRQRIN